MLTANQALQLISDPLIFKQKLASYNPEILHGVLSYKKYWDPFTIIYILLTGRIIIV